GYVKAVEIDPMFVKLGRMIDPDNTYDNSNVSIEINDARRFLSKNKDKYDIVFSNFLDSQSSASNHARFRLDSFLYTLEGLKLAYNALNDNGILIINFTTATEWIQYRIFTILTMVSKHNVLAFKRTHGLQSYYFISKGRKVRFKAKGVINVTDKLRQKLSVKMPTDDWPFLYSYRPVIPKEHLRLLGYIFILLCVAFIISGQFNESGNKHISDETAVYPYLLYAFFSGAAFFFIEIYAIAVMTPIFGSTYMGQSLVVMAVISVSLFGSILAHRFPFLSKSIVWIFLLCSILLNFFAAKLVHPIYGVFLRSTPLIIILFVIPLFWSGYLYLSYLREVDGKCILKMQKWNMFGGAIGGAAECMVIVLGFRNSIWIAMLFYILALISIIILKYQRKLCRN
ncbi:spermidine synthase, partial [Elusimicrobiota bacterium]